MVKFSLKDELSFKKNGYLIKKTSDLNSLNFLQNFIFNTTIANKKNLKASNFSNKQNFFKNFHKFFSKNELNSVRLNIIKKINNNTKFDKEYFNASKEILEFLVSNELAMQTKINLSIQIPNDNSSMLPMHSDIYAGESPFEVVCWIPLVDVPANSQGMFITSPKNNRAINREVTKTKSKTILQIYNKYKKKFNFIKINFGEILVFSPILLHGNTINKTNHTRFSLNCRFKSLLSPFDVFSKTHRNIPHFFKPLKVKPLTKVGFNFINEINEKF